ELVELPPIADEAPTPAAASAILDGLGGVDVAPVPPPPVTATAGAAMPANDLPWLVRAGLWVFQKGEDPFGACGVGGQFPRELFGLVANEAVSGAERIEVGRLDGGGAGALEVALALERERHVIEDARVLLVGLIERGDGGVVLLLLEGDEAVELVGLPHL